MEDGLRPRRVALVGGTLVLATSALVLWLAVEAETDREGPAVEAETEPGRQAPEGRSIEAAGHSAEMQGEQPARTRRIAASARALALDPETRRALLENIMKKIAQRTASDQSYAGRQAEGTGQTTAGGLSADYIKQQMREIVPLVKECYEMALESQPDLAGKLSVRFTIAGYEEYGGLVTESTVMNDSSLIHATDLVECVRETMYAIRLKQPEGSGQVIVSYPFKFRPE